MWESPPIAASLWQERAQSTERKGHRLRPCPWIIVRGSAKSLLQPAPNGPNQPEGCAQQRGEAGPTVMVAVTKPELHSMAPDDQ